MKKILSALISVLIIFTLAAVPASSAEKTVYGDINGDNVVDMFDYLTIKNIYFDTYEPSAEELASADINGDGSVDMFDYLHIKRAYFLDEELKKPENGEWDTEAGYLDIERHYFSGYLFSEEKVPCFSETGDEIPSYLITSFEELDAFLSIYVDYGGCFQSEDFELFVESLHENYFEETVLLLTSIGSGSGMDILDIEGVYLDENGMTMTVSRRQASCGTCDMQYRLLTAEISRSDIGGCRTHRTVFEELPMFVGFKDTILRAEVPSLTAQASEGRVNGTIPAMLVRNEEELAQLAGLCRESDAEVINEYIENMPDGFFYNYALAVGVGVATSGGDIFSVNFVGFDDNYDVVLEVVLNEIGVTEDMQYVLIMCEIENYWIDEDTVIRGELTVIPPEI